MINPERPNERADGLTIISEILVVVSLLGGGAFIGERLARYVAPNHAILQLAGLVMLPLSLVLGLMIWLGSGLIREFWGTQERRSAFRWRRPKGALLLFPVILVVAVAMAFAACACSNLASPFVFNLYVMVGTVYGLTSWLFAYWGFFDFWKWIGD